MVTNENRTAVLTVFGLSFAAISVLIMTMVFVISGFVEKTNNTANAKPTVSLYDKDFELSKDTKFAIFRIWSAHYDDEKYAPQFSKNGSMADAVFAYLIDRHNELEIKNDRYRRSAIYDKPGPLPEDGIVPGGQ